MLDLAALLLTFLAALVAARGVFRLRGTTLVSPGCWLLGALVLGGLWRGAVRLQWTDADSSAAEATGFLCAMATLLPAVALLGAKRPQHLAWNWVVAALGLMVSLPAIECLLFGRAAPAHDLGLRGWFLWVLWCLTLVTYLPTRQWASSLLAAGGQVLWLGEYLPLVQGSIVENPAAWGQCLLAGSVLAAGIVDLLPRRHPAGAREWLDFRDSFGLFWALRVQERMNDSAQRLGWDYLLLWGGPVRKSDGRRLEEIADEGIRRGVRNAWSGLVRRFVCPQEFINNS